MRTKHLKGQCQACGWPIEFPAEAVGSTIDCPHCGKSTELMLAVPTQEPTIPRSTIVWTLITILLLLAGLGGALIALKRAEHKAAAQQQIERSKASPNH